ncbi:MAG: Mfa1 family fimbria major subunit [Paludibacter sp.]|jgi:hypothetical protein|nr:Mfa1 family fimbria major subunit [Paludibacter sp.]
MKKSISLFLFAALLFGFASCKNDDLKPNEELQKEQTTYMGITIRLPQASSRKAPAADDDPNYNLSGNFSGVTGVATIDLYLISSDGATMLDHRRLISTNGDFTFATQGAIDHIVLMQPFKTTPGDKKLIVVVNSPEALMSDIPSDDYLYTISSSMPLSSIARVDNAKSIVIDGRTVFFDAVTLSGKSDAFTILDGVSAQEVAQSGKNTIDIDIVRLPSRLILTKTASASVIKDNVTLGTISNITYSVAQGSKAVHLFQQLNADNTAKSYGYSYLPGPGTDYNTTAINFYDYSDLQNVTDTVPDKPSDYVFLPGKFLLENTHLSGANESDSRYRKGNTAYVLVRAKFTPAANQIADGQPLTNGTFYVGGIDGRIYSSKTAAQTYREDLDYGVANQPVTQYDNGKVLYYIWLNPDNKLKPVNSPVIRNNIYHINIASFKSIGVNWNPLIPTGPGTPHNPDPKPDNPDEPTNPIDPTEPLSSTDTYMTVDITILPWIVHTYDIDL